MTGRTAAHRDHEAFVAALERRLKVVVVSSDSKGRRIARGCIPLEFDPAPVDGHEGPRYYLWDCEGRGPDGSQIVSLAPEQIVSIRLTTDRYGSSDFGPSEADRRWSPAGELG